MSDTFGERPFALSGATDFREPNAAIKLYEGRLKISGEEEQVLEGMGYVELSWLPSPALRFFIHGEETFSFLYSSLDDASLDDKLFVELLEADTSLEGFWTSRSNYSLAGVITGKAESFSDEEIQYVTFCIPNFNDFIGEAIKYSESSTSAARMSFVAGDWETIIDGLSDKKATYKTLENEGGYAVTHVGRLQKTDLRSFDVEEVKQLCGKLYTYLSFCRGAFCGPILLTGHDREEKVVWKDWSRYRTDPWKGHGTWFPVYQIAQTKPVFQAYFLKTRDDKWDEALHGAIEWVVEAQNASTEDMGIVHAQIGIELLAWVKFVEIDRAVSRDGFKKLTAVDRIQLLLSWAGIPTDIPKELENLTRAVEAKQKTKGEPKWETGPAAIIDLRNSIAHPNLRDRTANVAAQAKYEVRQLAVWYLELLILRFLDYQGEIHNRWKHKWVGETELVPWATNL